MQIIKRGLNSVSYNLKSGKVIVFKGNYVSNYISENDYLELMSEYGNFIRPRIVTENNPDGVFVIGKSENYVKDKDNAEDSFVDNSAPVVVEKGQDTMEAIIQNKRSKHKGKRR